MFVTPGAPWHLDISLGDLHVYAGAPIGIQLNTQHVAANFAQDSKVLEIVKANTRIYSKTPPYLIPALREKLPSVDLKPVVALVSKGKIAPQKAGGGYVLNFDNKAETDFTVSGVVPADAKPGDTFLVQLTAQYPQTGRLPARSVGFLEILIVKSK